MLTYPTARQPVSIIWYPVPWTHRLSFFCLLKNQFQFYKLLVSSFFILYVNNDVESTLEAPCRRSNCISLIGHLNFIICAGIFCKQNNQPKHWHHHHQKPLPVLWGGWIRSVDSQENWHPQQLQNEEICIILLRMSDVGFF